MTATGLTVWHYGLLLCVLTVLASTLEGRAMLRVALALLANWAVHMVWWLTTFDPSPYAFSIVVDTCTAVIVLSRPAGRMQALIGWSLLVQITIHFAYGFHMLVGGYAVQAETKYWAWLDWIALAQLVLAGGWTLGGTGRHLLGNRSHGHRERVDADDPSGMAHP